MDLLEFSTEEIPQKRMSKSDKITICFIKYEKEDTYSHCYSPESVELLENKKGSIITPGLNKIVDIQIIKFYLFVQN